MKIRNRTVANFSAPGQQGLGQSAQPFVSLHGLLNLILKMLYLLGKL
jgi:hypothetical protein